MSRTRTFYTPEFKDRTVWMMEDHRRLEACSRWVAAEAVSQKLGVSAHTMNNWAKQARRDAGEEAGPTNDELEELTWLRREVKELKRANEILKSASAFSPRSSSAPPRDDPVHRRTQGSFRGRADLPRPGR